MKPSELKDCSTRLRAWILSALLAGSVIAVVTDSTPAIAAAPGLPGSTMVEPIGHWKPSVESLPPPYSNWDVTLEQDADYDNPHVLELQFNSPLLDRRVDNTVFVPHSYQATGSPSAVLYALHGTVVPILNFLDLPLETEPLLDDIGTGGGYKQTEVSRYDSQLDSAKFLVVAPDTTHARPFCETCSWVDGREDLLPSVTPVTAETLPADSFLHQELYPLVEELFNVRTDRGGRGVTGYSMGAWGAVLQAFIHPDDYSFVAAVSGPYDFFTEPKLREFSNSVGYLRDQGYGTPQTDEIWWRNFNPASITANITGIDLKYIHSAGNPYACLTDQASHPDCQAYPPATNPFAATIETLTLSHLDVARRDLPAKGIPAEFVESPGVHGANNHLVYSDYIVPEANHVFASAVEQPASFSYRTATQDFEVWGFKVELDRPNDEFLQLSNVRMDGRSMTVSGSGHIRILTRPTFVPNQTYTIVVDPDSGLTKSFTSKVNDQGRLLIEFNLGDANLLDHSSIGDTIGFPQTHSATVRVT